MLKVCKIYCKDLTFFNLLQMILHEFLLVMRGLCSDAGLDLFSDVHTLYVKKVQKLQ